MHLLYPFNRTLFRGDIRVLAEDIKELQPTLVLVVPRVLNRLYDKVWNPSYGSVRW